MLESIVGGTASWTSVILGVGLLIFIHEAGHFLVAKLAGVRVLAFSLGFGPVLTGFHRGGTHYRLSLIPLGGYVKMSGETELPEGGYAPDDFPAQPIWVRTLIIAAGVIMNAILAFALFAGAFAFGVTLPPAEAGVVIRGGAAWQAGMRAGDRVVAVNGHELIEFSDLLQAALAGEPMQMLVDRGGREFMLEVVPRFDENSGRSAIGVAAPMGERLTVEASSAAEEAGFRAGDRIVAVQGVPMGLADILTGAGDVEAILPLSGPTRITLQGEDGTTRVLELLPASKRARLGIAAHRTSIAAVRPGGTAQRTGWRAGDRPIIVDGHRVDGAWSFRTAMLRPRGDRMAEVRVERDGRILTLPLAPAGNLAVRAELLSDLQFADPESPTRVEVQAGGPAGEEGPRLSPAADAGITSGSRLLSVDGSPVASFQDILQRITDADGRPVRLEWENETGKHEAKITPAEYFDARSLLPAGLGYTSEDHLVTLSGPAARAPAAFDRCVAHTRNIFATIKGMVSGNIASKNLGGPIMIARVARDSVDAGAGRFMWILAILSINLMVLNSLPVPLLDGGQLALLMVEGIMGRPPPENIVVMVQWAGLIALLGLMLFTTFHDVARLFAS